MPLEAEFVQYLATLNSSEAEFNNLPLVERSTIRRNFSQAQGNDVSLTILSKLASIEEAVGAKKIPRRGSDVTVADYNHTFHFTQAQYEYAPKPLCWKPKHMKEFENKAKEILLSKYVDEFISFANDPKRKEVKDIQPLLTQLFSDLLPVAFPTKDFKQLKIGRIEYVDAQIVDANTQHIIVYKGFTDLSIVHNPLELSLGGSETKISKKDVAEGNNVNPFGKKAVAQTGSQILGAVQKLKKFIVDVDPFSMIATNGWQWIFVQRKLGKDGCFFYYHLPAISFGECSKLEGNAVNQDDDDDDDEDDDVEETEPKEGVARQKRTVFKKPESNHCYGEICHLLALMFDNAEFFWQQLEDSELLNKIDMVSLNPREESSSDEGHESEAENLPTEGQSWSKSSAGVKSKSGPNSGV